MNSSRSSADQGERAITMGRQVLDIEAAAVDALARRLGANFGAAVKLILDSPGRVIVSGIGKLGHVGRKMAVTLASTGTPAYFVHAAEAVHGDLVMDEAGKLCGALNMHDLFRAKVI